MLIQHIASVDDPSDIQIFKQRIRFEVDMYDKKQILLISSTHN